MIFAIDHIAFTCSDTDEICRRLKEMGYKETFSEIGLANPEIKKGLMKRWTPLHDMFFFEKPPGLNIEVIRYDAVYGGKSFLSLGDGPLFSGNKIIITAPDLEHSYRFWSLFGVKMIKKHDNLYECIFQTPFSRGIAFFLKQGALPQAETSLDSEGFNCIAFRCTSIVNDRQALIKQGIEVTPIEGVVVNGKKLAIFFVKGAQGEKVEIVGYEH